MQSKKILVTLIAILISLSTQTFAQESGVCFVLTMKYTEQLPSYTRSKDRYENSTTNVSAGYGSPYTLSKTELEKQFNAEKAKINKITTAMKNAGCYSAEDEATVKAQLK